MSEIRSQATPARDKSDLADIIHIHVCANNLEDCIGECRVAASDVIADGWSKPRTVNSAAELDALPDGSIILFGGMAWQACEFVSKTYPEGYICWVCHESWRGELGSADVIPATVLFTPGEAG